MNDTSHAVIENGEVKYRRITNEKLAEHERLEGEVAMLRDILQEFYNSFVDCVEGGRDDEFMKSVIEALNATTSQQYDNKIKAKALREAAEMFRTIGYSKFKEPHEELERMAASLEK